MNAAHYVYTVLLRPAPLRAAANAVLRGLIPAELEYRGLRLALNPRDPVISGALRLGLYENDEVAWFEKLLRPGMTVIDAGANIGLYTALAARGVGPAGRVFALEPDPESFGYLLRTIAANGFSCVEPFRAAASSVAGTAQLHRNPHNRGDNRLYADPLLADPVAVETVRLDGLLAGRGIHSFHLLKMDVQGAEGLVLEGAGQLLANSPEATILMEFWPAGLSRTGFSARALLDRLLGDGFSLYEAAGALRPLRTASDCDSLVSRLPGPRYTSLIATRSPGAMP